MQWEMAGARQRRVAVTMRALGALCALTGCVRRPGIDRPGAVVPGEPPSAAAVARRGPNEAAMTALHKRMGLLTGIGEVPFVASVAHFASATGDSTVVLVGLSMSNRALSFQRDGDRYRAPYEVRLDVRRRDSTVVRRIAADEVVRVAAYKETSRGDESVLFYQYISLPPDTYTLTVAVRDANSGRSAVVDAPLRVPRFGPGTLSTPVLAYESAPRARLDTLPRLTTSVRATATFGVDSLVALYVEGYDAPGAVAPSLPLRVTARGERDVVVWSDTASIARRDGEATAPVTLYDGVVWLPLSQLGIGVTSLDVARRDPARRDRSPLGTPAFAGAAPATDLARTSLFVSLGPDLPISSFDEMLGYLRYYATPERLRTLRETAPEQRAAAWLAFLRTSDPIGTTREHEALRDYFARVRTANLRFTDDGGPGWLTDRGMTYIVLGEPDQIADPTGQDASARGRTQRWQYRTAHLQLTFADQTGFGRWRLTPASVADVQQAMRRAMVK